MTLAANESQRGSGHSSSLCAWLRFKLTAVSPHQHQLPLKPLRSSACPSGKQRIDSFGGIYIKSKSGLLARGRLCSDRSRGDSFQGAAGADEPRHVPAVRTATVAKASGVIQRRWWGWLRKGREGRKKKKKKKSDRTSKQYSTEAVRNTCRCSGFKLQSCCFFSSDGLKWFSHASDKHINQLQQQTTTHTGRGVGE